VDHPILESVLASLWRKIFLRRLGAARLSSDGGFLTIVDPTLTWHRPVRGSVASPFDQAAVASRLMRS
jgi:hypothetical protein